MSVEVKDGTKGALKVVADAATDVAIEVASRASNAVKFQVSGAGIIGANGQTPPTAVTAFTQTYATTDTTLSAYTADAESSAYAGMTSSSDGVVYAKLADLNALRTAYETLRGHAEDVGKAVNSVIDALQAQGIVG